MKSLFFKGKVVGMAIILSALTAFPVIADQDPLKQCEREIKKAGFDPADFNIFFGTEGGDQLNTLEEAEAFCGFGGDDMVVDNYGLFIGGNGNDFTLFNRNFATFNGGKGEDTVSNFQSGTCIDVEVGC